MELRGVGAAVVVCGLAVSGCGAGKLSFGEAATIESENGTVGVTVLRVEKGDASDLDQLEDSSSYAGETPYYVHYKLTKAKNGSTASGTNFDASDGSNQLTGLNVMSSVSYTGDPSDPFSFGEFDLCTPAPSEEFKEAEAGQDVEGCDIFLADSGTGTPTTIEWVEDDKTLAAWGN